MASTTFLYSANSASQPQLLQYRKHPVGLQNYKLYTTTESDKIPWNSATPSYLLPRNTRKLLDACFHSESKVYSSLKQKMFSAMTAILEVGLAKLKFAANIPTDGVPREEEMINKTSIQPSELTLQIKSFLPKAESIYGTTVFMHIKDVPNYLGLYHIDLRSTYGEVLLVCRYVRLSRDTDTIIKAIRTTFRAENFLFILNSSVRQECLDCLFFQQIMEIGIDFVYLQKSLHIFTRIRPFIPKEGVYTFDKNKMNPSPNYWMFLTEKEEHGTIIGSVLGLRVHLDNKLNELRDLTLKWQEAHQLELSMIGIRDEQALFEIGFSLINCFIHNHQRSTPESVQNMVQTVVDYLKDKQEYLTNIVSEEEKDVNPDDHFAFKLIHCKECRVCVKDYEKASGPSKLTKKKRKIQARGQCNLPKIHKSKYGCEACTAHYGRDIVMCVTHFKKFHHDQQFYMGQNYIKGKGSHESNPPEMKHAEGKLLSTLKSETALMDMAIAGMRKLQAGLLDILKKLLDQSNMEDIVQNKHTEHSEHKEPSEQRQDSQSIYQQ